MTSKDNSVVTTSAMSKLTGVFNTDALQASHFMKCLHMLAQSTEGFDYKKVWTDVFDDSTWDEREALIKKRKRHAAKKASKFTAPKELASPKNMRNRFRDDYRAKCNADGVVYNNNNFNVAYNALTEAEKDRYKALYEAEQKAYEVKYNQLMTAAIESGDFMEAKPTGPKAPYIFYMAECRNPNNTLLTADEKATIAKEPGAVTVHASVISNAYKRHKDDPVTMAPFVKMAADAKAKYKVDEYNWKIRCLERQLAKLTREGGETSRVATELETLKSNPPSKVVPVAPVVASVSSAPETAKAPAKSRAKGKGPA